MFAGIGALQETFATLSLAVARISEAIVLTNAFTMA
jgi:hypothetical protein